MMVTALWFMVLGLGFSVQGLGKLWNRVSSMSCFH